MMSSKELDLAAIRELVDGDYMCRTDGELCDAIRVLLSELERIRALRPENVRALIEKLRNSWPGTLWDCADAIDSLLAERETLILSLKTGDEVIARMTTERETLTAESLKLNRQLNSAVLESSVCLKCRTPHDGSQWSACERCSVVRTRFINELEDLLEVRDRNLSADEMLEQVRARFADLARVTAEKGRLEYAASFVLDYAADLGQCAICDGGIGKSDEPEEGECAADCPGRLLRVALGKRNGPRFGAP